MVDSRTSPKRKIDALSLSVEKFDPDLIIIDGLCVASSRMSQSSDEYSCLIEKIDRLRKNKPTSILLLDSAHKRGKDLGLIDRFQDYPLAKKVWNIWHLDYIENPLGKYNYWDKHPSTLERFLTIADRRIRTSIPISFNPENLSYSPLMGFFDFRYRSDITRIISGLKKHPGKSAKAIGKISGVSRVHSMLSHLDSIDRIELVEDNLDIRRKVYKASF